LNWIEYIKENDNQALIKLYSLYRDEFIEWLGRKYSIENNIAKDIFQTSIVVLYDNVISEKLTKLNSNIKTYLFGIGKNKAYEYLRDKDRSSKFSITQLDLSFNSESYNEQDERILKLTNTLSKMGGPCKEIIESFYYKEMDITAITAKMGYKNNDTTKNQKYKCIKRLQKLLSAHKYTID